MPRLNKETTLFVLSLFLVIALSISLISLWEILCLEIPTPATASINKNKPVTKTSASSALPHHDPLITPAAELKK